MSRKNINARKETSTQQIIRLLERDLGELKSLIKSAGKLKGKQKANALSKVDRKNINNVNNMLISFETAILTLQEENDYNFVQQLRKQYKQFEQKFKGLQKQLQFTRHQGRNEEQIYEDRNINGQMTKHEYATKIDVAQKESENAVKNMLRMLYQTKQIGNTVNAELERQLEALDSVNDNLLDAESNLNRALRHINYFARSVYTDKLLILLIILCIGAVIAIIVLSAMGKVPQPAEDSLT